MFNTVVIDLDNTITDFENCPHKDKCNYSLYPDEIHLHRDLCPVNRDAKYYMESIKDLGLEIVIFTSRVTRERPATIRWLRKHRIPFDEIVFNKPRGFMYIDDLGERFDGNWEKMYKKIEKHYNGD